MLFSPERPDWATEGRDWPNRDNSRFVEAGGLRWHVQAFGAGEDILLLHGTGAATHSFRDLAPLLGQSRHVTAPDLPGQGFTDMPDSAGMTLPGMARLTGSLLRKLDRDPKIAVGHSAGAAILIAMTLLGVISPRIIIALNGALVPMRGTALFSPLAKLLFLNPLMPRLFAWGAHGSDATRRLIEGTGSTLDTRGIALYERLFRKPGHVAGTLGMMANWDLAWLTTRFGELSTRLVLIASATDKTVPPSDADTIARKVPNAKIIRLGHGGHLMHEVDPASIAAIIEKEVSQPSETGPCIQKRIAERASDCQPS